ncbi:MAG TPA: hypothetical protein VNX47_01255 [Nevskia sp.]|nr:hypothetical protein [Nevskia sp.]
MDAAAIAAKMRKTLAALTGHARRARAADGKIQAAGAERLAAVEPTLPDLRAGTDPQPYANALVERERLQRLGEAGR